MNSNARLLEDIEKCLAIGGKTVSGITVDSVRKLMRLYRTAEGALLEIEDLMKQDGTTGRKLPPWSGRIPENKDAILRDEIQRLTKLLRDPYE